MTATTSPPVIICVFGATGTGKSSFINDATGGKQLAVGYGQMSCTDTVEMAPPFILDGRDIWLVDTPGFDDSSMSDTQVLEMIGEFMKQTYEVGQLISGFIYMHRITDNRFGGVATKNFRMLRELCGPDALKNLILCTNMWSEHPREEEERREEELTTSDKCFKPAIVKGARVARYMRHQGQQHAHDIIRNCLKNVPVATLYQEEVSQGASVGGTSAGLVLNGEMLQLVAKHQDEINTLERSHKEAIQKRDEETQQEIETERTRLKETVASLKKAIEKLNSSPGAEKRDGEIDKQHLNAYYQKIIQLIEQEITSLEEMLKKETDPEVEKQLRGELKEALKDKEAITRSLQDPHHSGNMKQLMEDHEQRVQRFDRKITTLQKKLDNAANPQEEGWLQGQLNNAMEEKKAILSFWWDFYYEVLVWLVSFACSFKFW
ncbi:unnamed protein product [Rhizoctonia solani]|uniref:AIG1-type G domain-containing protein n=1 Tax=Rhizoctonia solani TaxID=456999 RepID=A0A8H3GJ42_9AGAM|nr:unnamed protein product [Rhizoctonia solani]